MVKFGGIGEWQGKVTGRQALLRKTSSVVAVDSAPKDPVSGPLHKLREKGQMYIYS